MHNPFEELPEVDYSLGFPGGDISFADAAGASEVLEELMQGDINTQRKALVDMRESEIEDWRLLPGQNENYKALILLTHDWEYAIQDEFRGQQVAQIGVLSTLAFIKRSELITVEFTDLSKELESLSKLDEVAIMDFASDAWPNMGRSHTLLFNELLPFIVQLEKVNGTRKADESVRYLQGAAAVLPYLMANTTLLLGGLNNYIKDEELFIK